MINKYEIKNCVGYIPIRQSLDDKHYWLDMSCLSSSRESCIYLTETLNQRIPDWAKDNPVVEIRRVEILVGD